MRTSTDAAGHRPLAAESLLQADGLTSGHAAGRTVADPLRLAGTLAGAWLRPARDPGQGRVVVDLPEPDCWLHPDVEIRSSPIAGLGLFATAPIRAGTVVSRVGGRLVSTTELHDLFAAAATDPDHSFIDTIAATETRHLVLPPRRRNRYGNHSCDPNLWWVGAYELAARRRIGAGEELTNDYATSTGDDEFTMACSCRSAYCRRTITGRDWRLPDLHQRYGDHWVPVLQTRIRRLTDTAAPAVQPATRADTNP